MKGLENKNPSLFHVIRRSNQYWAGLGCDLVIEQTLMRSLKTAGGLMRGSSMSEHQRVLWTMSAPVASEYSDMMQDSTHQNLVTNEQHKEASVSRTKRDRKDLQKIVDKLQAFSPL